MTRLGTGTVYKCDGCADEHFETEGLCNFFGGARNRGYTLAYRDHACKILSQKQELWFCSIGCLLTWVLAQTEDRSIPISQRSNPGPPGTTNDADDWRALEPVMSDE